SVDPTVAVEGKRDDALARVRVLEVLVAGDGISARARDLRDDGVGDRSIETAAVLGNARIVDDNARTALRQQPGIGRAEAPAGASHDDHLAVEADRLISWR